VDPEDLQAHYNMMLCYQGLGQPALAARSRALYERFKADESSQALTGPYRRLHPDDNNERQAVHEHRGVPLAATVTSPRPARPAQQARRPVPTPSPAATAPLP
jgi:hypothetical protein